MFSRQGRGLGRTIVTALGLATCLLLARPAESGLGRVYGQPGDQQLDLTVYFTETDRTEQEWNDVYTRFETVFAAYSDALYEATEGQLRLGTVTFTHDETLKATADVWVQPKAKGASATPNGLGIPGTHITIYEERHGCTGEPGGFGGCSPADSRGQFGLLHESGHYLFNLDDEYRGCTRKAAERPCVEAAYGFPLEGSRTLRQAVKSSAPVRGIVTNEAGAGVGQMTVVLERLVAGQAPGTVGEVTTGADGRFELQAAETGQHRLWIRDTGALVCESVEVDGATTKTTTTSAPVILFEVEETTKELECGFHLRATATAEGATTGTQIVSVEIWQHAVNSANERDAGDQPLAGIPVTLVQLGTNLRVGAAVTGAQGRVRFEDLPPTYFKLRVLGLEPNNRISKTYFTPQGERTTADAQQQAPDVFVFLNAPAADNKTYYCSVDDQQGDGHGCVMDGGTSGENNTRSEFCTSQPAADGKFFHCATNCKGGDPAVLVSNAQELLHGMGCWQAIARSKVPLLPPEALPGRTSPDPTAQGAAPAPRFRRAAGGQAVALLLDVSDSLDDAQRQIIKTEASNYIDRMRTGDWVGVVGFSTQADQVRGVQRIEADRSVAEDAKTFIEQLGVGGFTNVEDGLRVALDELGKVLPDPATSDTDPFADARILLVTDGRSTVGGDPLDVLKEDLLDSKRVQVQTIVVGPNADMDLLRSLSARTSGTLTLAARPEDTALVAPGAQAAARGDTVLVRRLGSLDPASGTSITVPVNDYATELEFLLSHPTDPTMDLRLTSPSGVVFDHLGSSACVQPPGGARDCNTDVEYFESPTQRFFRLPEAYREVGDWTVTVLSNRVTGGPEPFGLLATAATPDLQVVGVVDGAFGPVSFPDPIRLRVIVSAPEPLVGAEVTAALVQPGGFTETIVLFDDGLIEHGDEHALDGVYSALFCTYRSASQEGGDGYYRFDVTVKNVSGFLAGVFEDTDGEGEIQQAPPFEIRTEVSAEVIGIPDPISPGSLALGAGAAIGPIVQAPELFDATPVLGFELTAEGEHVHLMGLSLGSVGDGDETSIDEVALYPDEEGDGEIVNRSAPLAVGRFEEDDGTLTLATGAALATIPAGESRRFIIAMATPRPQQTPVSSLSLNAAPAPGGGLPLPPLPFVVLVAVFGLLALLARYAHRRPRVARVFAVMACLTLGVTLAGAIGCGGGGTCCVIDDPPPDGLVLGQYNLALNAADIAAVGATTGDPVTTTGGVIPVQIDVEAAP